MEKRFDVTFVHEKEGFATHHFIYIFRAIASYCIICCSLLGYSIQYAEPGILIVDLRSRIAAVRFDLDKLIVASPILII